MENLKRDFRKITLQNDGDSRFDEDDSQSKPDLHEQQYLLEFKKVVQHNLDRATWSKPKIYAEDSEGWMCAETQRFMQIIYTIPVEKMFAISDHQVEPWLVNYIEKCYERDEIGLDLHSSKPIRLPLEFDSSHQYQSIYVPLILLDTCARIRQVYSEKRCCRYVSQDEECFNGECHHFVGRRFEIDSVESVSGGLFVLETDKVVKFEFKCHVGQLIFDELREQPFTNWFALLISPKSSRVIAFGLITRQKCGYEEYMQLWSDASRQKVERIPTVFFTIQFYNATDARSIESSIIVPLCYLRPSLRLVNTLVQLNSREELFRTILKPKIESFTHGTVDNASSSLIGEYNAMQRHVIGIAKNLVGCTFHGPKFQLVQGPPGTGKTYTLIGIVQNLLAMHRSTESGNFRIMVCTPSNGATDEICRRLLELRDDKLLSLGRPLHVVRVGIREKIAPDVFKCSLAGFLSQPTLTGSELTDEDRVRYSNAILLSADVILTTLGSSQNDALQVFESESCGIDCLIVDEASQCSEAESLLPLLYPSIRRIILIGDHLQLPATVISPKASHCDYGRSLFERFHRHFESLSVATMLTNQFRMRDEICRFPSKAFYRNQLVTVRGSGYNPKIMVKHPYFVFDIVDSQEQNAAGWSKFNSNEANFIATLLQVLQVRDSKGEICDDITIGVITFYKAQVNTIQKCLEETIAPADRQQVTVNTVDGYQGQERDIIVLSCVRATSETKAQGDLIGFVRSPRRMNVALTRAKSILAVCLSGNTFAHAPVWKRLIDDAIQRRRFFRVVSTLDKVKLSELLEKG